MRIPEISAATSDTGSDTEVLFTPKSLENNDCFMSLNKHNENLRNDDGSQLNIFSNNKTLGTGNSFNVNNSDTSTSSPRFNISIPSTSLEEKCDILLNDLKNENDSNISTTVSSTFLNNHNLCDKLLSSKECVQELKNGLLDHIKNSSKNKFNQSGDKINNLKSIMNNDLIEDNGNITQLNRRINDFNSSDKLNSSKSDSKPIKLNMVSTEPYPKYTPTVEKAIKKYKNKEPKKDCIIM